MLSLDTDFTGLLQKLGPGAKDACLLTGDGDGWAEKIAWNPCAAFSLESADDIEKLNEFILKHQKKNDLLVGFLGYSLGLAMHNISPAKKDRDGLGLAVFYAYDNYLERRSGKIYAHHDNENFIEQILKADKSIVKNTTNSAPRVSFKRLWERKAYGRAFKKIQDHIYNGDIYQINLTQELEAEHKDRPRKLFADLSTTNSGKMKAYFEGKGFEIISMSPERFIRTQGKNIETSPIKGTRPRGKNAAEDKNNEADLLADEKEKAELNMITDLLRNDLGKVCSTGSVRVINKRKVEKLTAVMHTYSLIRGSLKEMNEPFQALLSMFPGGSITGCPKKKAMEIIDRLEQSGRGAYCGSMVVIDERGNLDSSILIRTVVRKGRRLSLSVGSGIVYDSVEEKEYRENLEKIRLLDT